MTDTATMDGRRELRRQARAARRAFVAALALPVRRGLEAALARQLAPRLGPPGLLGSHCATGDEIDPTALEVLASALGWTVAFPRVTGAAPLAFHVAPRAALLPGFRGIPEPPPGLPPVRPHLLLVPLLAADRAGNRLGQGGGHYDRSLAVLRGAGPLIAIGLAWNMQLVDALTPAPWDQPLDAVATPTAFHLTTSAARTAP
jgi:5-formyltetrahydrofolate cyclo-ligase